MYKRLLVIPLILLLSILISWNRKAKEVTKTDFNNQIALATIRPWLVTEIESIQVALQKIKQSSDSIVLRSSYFLAREHYKHIEFFVEYVSQRDAKYIINGPLVPKNDLEQGKVVIEAQGFQLIESMLFGTPFSISTDAVSEQVNILNEQFEFLKGYYSSIDLDDPILLEMLQLQLYRMVSLNLNGYDATISKTNVNEAISNLKGFYKVLEFFKPYCKSDSSINCLQALIEEIKLAETYLGSNKDYNTFNRLEFITKHVNPINLSLVKFHNLIGLPWSDRKHAVKLKTGYLFNESSLNKQYFSLYYNDTFNLKLKADLGKKLFFDPLLSGNNKVACANCHNPKLAFSDGLKKSKTIDGVGQTERNAPSLTNVIFQKNFFYDGRAIELERQIFEVITNPIEMHSDFKQIVEKLTKNPEYTAQFSKAFAYSGDSGISEFNIQTVITEYEKTITSFNSRFDSYLNGNYNALTKREINGYNVFAGKALCGSCHFFPLFNGTVPPFFNDTEFEVIGTPATAANKTIDNDLGRYGFTNLDIHKYAFKTPGLRNIELTGPYMHNGVYKNLEEIIDFYEKGGGVGFGFNVPNQTLPFDSLELTKTEKKDIVLFLKSLTSN
jgi:cytochrome c peroxidase